MALVAIGGRLSLNRSLSSQERVPYVNRTWVSNIASGCQMCCEPLAVTEAQPGGSILEAGAPRAASLSLVRLYLTYLPLFRRNTILARA
jgi:hypothetical protein